MKLTNVPKCFGSIIMQKFHNGQKYIESFSQANVDDFIASKSHKRELKSQLDEMTPVAIP